MESKGELNTVREGGKKERKRGNRKKEKSIR
jgi:hypothetical protein